MTDPRSSNSNQSEIAAALRKGALMGAATFLVLLPPAASLLHGGKQSTVTTAIAHNASARTPAPPSAGRPAPALQRSAVPRTAHFGQERASREVRQMANWVATTNDNGAMSFVIVDKTRAKVYVFDRNARIKAAAPALLGSAIGDDTAPGIGDKPIAQVLPEEKTTPAGRFVAEPGTSSSRGEDVVWVDYDAAVSMHRVLNKPERLKSLHSATYKDNRMSFGCINLPTKFYEQVLRPSVDRGGAVIYILPETRSLQATFASFYEVQPSRQMADQRKHQRRTAKAHTRQA
jgi:hypothetical protein